MLLSDEKGLVDCPSVLVGIIKKPLYMKLLENFGQPPPVPASQLKDLGYINLVGYVYLNTNVCIHVCMFVCKHDC